MRRSRTRLPATSFGWPKDVRLRRAAEVRRLYRAPRTKWHDGLRVLALPRPVDGGSRMAVSTVRGFSSAVARNRARRRAREAARLLRPQLIGGHDVLVMVRPQLLRVGSSAVIGQLESALRQARLLRDASSPRDAQPPQDAQPRLRP